MVDYVDGEVTIGLNFAFGSKLSWFKSVFYGGYIEITHSPFADEISIDIVYNNGRKILDITEKLSEGPKMNQIERISDVYRYADILQKQNMIGFIRIFGRTLWIIDYSPLNSTDSNGKRLHHIL